MKIFFVHKDILLVTFSANCCLFTKGEVGLIANFANLNFKRFIILLLVISRYYDFIISSLSCYK